MSDRTLYFSYGHNTNVREFMHRIPGAQLLGRATVHGFKFVLEHFSDIRQDPKSVIQGVLWLIPTDKIPALDVDEAYRDHYHHITLNVRYGDKNYRALSYQMYKSYHSQKLPTKKYINFIAKGYKESHIPLIQLINAVKERLDREKHKDEEPHKSALEKQPEIKKPEPPKNNLTNH